MIGKTVSHYQITEKLGGGGMGVVYRARDKHLDRDVALKFLPAHLSTDGEAQERFIQEAKAASALDHPNICTIHDVDVSDEGELFIAMAFYSGETLKKKLVGGALPRDEALGIASQVAAGLSASNNRGIVHRDVKPANLFVTTDGRVVILDFGLAKLAGAADITRSGSTLGTAAYMSPEQTRSEAVDHRTDIWSLGVVLYEMLSGRRPFEGDYEQAVSYAIVNEPVEPLPDLPEEVQEILRKALAKQASDRYESAGAMEADVKRVLAPQPVAAQEANPPVSPRTRWYAALSAVVILALAFVVWRQVGNDTVVNTPGDLPSVAVLPLRTFAAEPGQEYFADAMTEALITNLSKIEGLSVRSRQSIMRYAESEEPLPRIAEQLRVRYLLEGSVFWGLDSLRVDAQLIDGPTDTHIWSNQYLAEAGQVLRIQRDIALAIAREIGATLTVADQQRTPSPRRVDPEAYRLLLSAGTLREEYSSICEIMPESIQRIRQSIALDSSFAGAWQQLGGAVVWRAAFCSEAPLEEEAAEARSYLQQAMRLDPSLPGPHRANAALLQLEGQWESAERAIRRAIQVAPSGAVQYADLCQFLLRVGRLDDALVAAKKAIEMDPVNPFAQQVMGQVHFYRGEYDLAKEWTQKWSDSAPRSGAALAYLASAYWMTGMEAEALATAQASVSADSSELSLGLLGYLYATTGNKEKATDLLRGVASRGGSYAAAFIHLGLGDQESALDGLEQALGSRPVTWSFIAVDPFWDLLRSEPRFQAIMRQLGLEPEP